MVTLTDHGWGSPPLHTLVMANRPPQQVGTPGPCPQAVRGGRRSMVTSPNGEAVQRHRGLRLGTTLGLTVPPWRCVG